MRTAKTGPALSRGIFGFEGGKRKKNRLTAGGPMKGLEGYHRKKVGFLKSCKDAGRRKE